MAIIVNGQQVSIEGQTATIVAEDQPVAPPVQQVNRPIRERTIVQRRNPSDPVLVVNGKEKKIGKKSQYLLDMMIIEE
jgi:hypothetical protein